MAEAASHFQSVDPPPGNVTGRYGGRQPRQDAEIDDRTERRCDVLDA